MTEPQSLNAESTTTRSENKRLMEDVFATLARGDVAPFLEVLADDVRWIILGSTPFSGTYDGKQTLQRDLFAPLFGKFTDRYRNEPSRFIAEGEQVVVESHGRATLKSGQHFDNFYCFIFRFRDGKVQEVREYLDTQLVASALVPPALA